MLQKVKPWEAVLWVFKLILLVLPFPISLLSIGFHSSALTSLELLAGIMGVLAWLVLALSPIGLFLGALGFASSTFLVVYHGWQVLSSTEGAQSDLEQTGLAFVALVLIGMRRLFLKVAAIRAGRTVDSAPEA